LTAWLAIAKRLRQADAELQVLEELQFCKYDYCFQDKKEGRRNGRPL